MITVLSIVGILALLGYFWYASLVGRRNKALEALSGIDVQYNMRFDLIPNVLKIAQKFMDHEKSLLQEITELRTDVQRGYDKASAAAVTEHLGKVEALNAKMGGVMIAMENYPELKSDATMIKVMQTYNEVESNIAAARRFYNASVTELNNAVQIFPGNVIAGAAGITPMPFLEVAEASKVPVNASDYLR